MPNRILKESICTSDTVDQLTWFEECFFTRLIVNCDDYGRMDARPAILRARLFPLKVLTDKQIGDALNKLATVGMTTVYEYDGRPYLQLVTWEDHQTIRAKKSKFPSLDESEIICKQMQADASRCSRNPIQSNPNPNPIRASADMFGDFWDKYPKRKSKGDAEKAWAKIKPSEELLSTMLAAIETQQKSKEWLKDDGQFIPHPATWLNAKGWEDEAEQKPDIPKEYQWGRSNGN